MLVDHQQNHVITKPELVFVSQLNFSSDIVEEIQNYNYKTILRNMPESGFEFHTKFDNGGVRVVELGDWEVVVRQEKPKYLEKIQTLIEKEWTNIDPDSVIKNMLRVNLNIGISTNRQSGIHLDVVNTWTNEWSALVHLNESDGPTDFFASKIIQDVVVSVPFKPGQVIIFPSVYAHRGSVPSSTDRYTINYIQRVDTKLNKQVLKR